MFSLTRVMLVLVAVLCLAIPFRPTGAVLDRPASLIVHEWGTFTSVSTADGRAQYWDPLTGPSELPSFVYRTKQDECVKCGLWLVRMETPVLYFYPAKRMEVSVNVGFPQGRISEWYPQAQSVTDGIRWSDVTLLPGEQVSLPVEECESHYYPARETDAAPVRTSDSKKPEWEKFLFYRGTANFDVPLTVALAGGTVEVASAGQHEVARIIVFENRAGKIGWSTAGPLKGRLSIPRPALGQSVASVQGELQRVLVLQGLYEKEVAAMIRTWRDSWFEEGLRVLYMVPREVTDTVLPLAVTPRATEINRVFVGRAEVITPEMEQDIEAAVRDFSGPSDEERKMAVRTVQSYGRFAGPVLRRLNQNASTTEARARIGALILAAKTK